jgi:putative membrane protein
MLAAIAAGMGNFDGDGHMGDGWWWVMGVGWLIFLAAVIAIAIALTRNHRASAGSRRSAHDTLDDRFARGEIDADEYQTRRDMLRG